MFLAYFAEKPVPCTRLPKSYLGGVCSNGGCYYHRGPNLPPRPCEKPLPRRSAGNFEAGPTLVHVLPGESLQTSRVSLAFSQFMPGPIVRTGSQKELVELKQDRFFLLGLG